MTVGNPVPRVRIERHKSETLAYIERTGSYDKLPFESDIARLYAWAKEHHLRPGMRPIALYLDPPETPPERLRTRIAIAVHGPALPEGGVGVETLPAMEVATIRHKGPTRDYPKTYGILRDWTDENGYEWVGPSIERYLSKPRRRGSDTVLSAKVQVPVRKRAPG